MSSQGYFERSFQSVIEGASIYNGVKIAKPPASTWYFNKDTVNVMMKIYYPFLLFRKNIKKDFNGKFHNSLINKYFSGYRAAFCCKYFAFLTFRSQLWRTSSPVFMF